MDPIHPIRPSTEQPAAVEPVTRVLRAGEDPARDRRERPRRRPAADPPVPDGVTPDGHVDVRA